MQVETHKFKFHNDLNQNTNVRNNSKLDECINTIVKKEGYISCDIRKKAVPADGGNYLAILCEIDVKGKTADGDKETAIFVKSITPESNVMELLSVPSVYKTELFVYRELFKIFDELQDEANIPANKRYKTLKCYDESYDEAIIMENVNKKGFKTWYRMDVVSFEMAEKCIKQLGRLHGLSFMLEKRRPDYFANKIKTMKTPHNFSKGWREFLEKFYKIGMDYLDADLRSRIQNKVLNILNKMKEYYGEQSINCLCHGDFRPNNVMFKEVDGKVTEVLPLDYQLMFYGCPILDFLYFIYMATDRQFRRIHIVNLKNIYYKSLEEFLQYFNISVDSVFSRTAFENLYQEKLDYGLMLSFLFCPFLFVSEEEEVPDLMNKVIVDIDFKFDSKFKARLKETVEEFIELGFL